MRAARTRRIRASVLALLVGLPVATGRAAPPKVDLGTITGAFIFRICQFVTWPESAFDAPDAAFHICVVGDDPREVSSALEKGVADKRIHGRAVEVHGLGDVEAARTHVEDGGSCQLVFMSDDDAADSVPSMADIAGGPRTLLMGESLDFLDAGGLLSLVLVRTKGRPQLYVNTAELDRSDLRFDSRFRQTLREP